MKKQLEKNTARQKENRLKKTSQQPQQHNLFQNRHANSLCHGRGFWAIMLSRFSINLHAKKGWNFFPQHGGSCPFCEACPSSTWASPSEEGGHGETAELWSHFCISLGHFLSLAVGKEGRSLVPQTRWRRGTRLHVLSIMHCRA